MSGERCIVARCDQFVFAAVHFLSLAGEDFEATMRFEIPRAAPPSCGSARPADADAATRRNFTAAPHTL